jgi:hypothetical protein
MSITLSPDLKPILLPGLSLAINLIITSNLKLKFDFIYYKNSVEMLKRNSKNNVKLQSRGIFVGSRVIRGYDWDWANQDGMG